MQNDSVVDVACVHEDGQGKNLKIISQWKLLPLRGNTFLAWKLLSQFEYYFLGMKFSSGLTARLVGSQSNELTACPQLGLSTEFYLYKFPWLITIDNI